MRLLWPCAAMANAVVVNGLGWWRPRWYEGDGFGRRSHVLYWRRGRYGSRNLFDHLNLTWGIRDQPHYAGYLGRGCRQKMRPCDPNIIVDVGDKLCVPFASTHAPASRRPPFVRTESNINWQPLVEDAVGMNCTLMAIDC